MSLKITYLGSKPIGYACLQHLLERKEELDIEVVALRTRFRKEFEGPGDLTALAREHNIPLLDSLDEIPECDIIYSVQHHELLQPVHIARASRIAVNLHLAPLPEYRGCNQFSFAIMDDAKEFGATIHEIDARIDHGALLFEHRFSIPDHCWVNDLYQLAYNAAVKLFRESLPDLATGRYQKVTQAELKQTRSEHLHFRSEIEQLKYVDLNQSAEEIARRIRATYMPGFEPPYTEIDGKKVYFSVQ
jgi:methionyl-tRNA formyltransferase